MEKHFNRKLKTQSKMNIYLFIVRKVLVRKVIKKNYLQELRKKVLMKRTLGT